MTAGILPVFRGSKFFSNKEVGQINKNLNIEYKEVNTGSDIFGKKFEAMKEEKSGGWGQSPHNERVHLTFEDRQL